MVTGDTGKSSGQEPGSGIISGGTYQLISGINNTSVLDVTGGATADGTGVQLYQSNATPAQQWVVTSVGNGYYKLQPVHAPGKALDINGIYLPRLFNTLLQQLYLT